jgi:ATP-dependent helicase/nuclease subunit A
VWRYRPVPPRAGAPIASATQEPATLGELPSWLTRDVPREVASAPPLSPSRAHDAEMPPKRGGRAPSGQLAFDFAAESAPISKAETSAPRERAKAMARGVIVHRLLQSLPDIPRAVRDEAARQHLARNGKAFSPEEQEAMLAQVRRVLDDRRFAELFAPGSRAEISIVGRLQQNGCTVAVSGQVDRLVVTADAVLIADYKTNRMFREDGRERPYAPRRIEDVPEAYVTQLALYRAVLGQLYPDKAIRAVLIWTEVPDLMEVSAAALDQALAAVTSA